MYEHSISLWCDVCGKHYVVYYNGDEVPTTCPDCKKKVSELNGLLSGPPAKIKVNTDGSIYV